MPLSKHATTAATIGNELIVTYHQTVIVKASDKEITLNFGHEDYVTKTTIKKMNEASQEYNLGFRVKREKGLVKVSYHEPINRAALRSGFMVERKHENFTLDPKKGEISLTILR